MPSATNRGRNDPSATTRLHPSALARSLTFVDGAGGKSTSCVRPAAYAAQCRFWSKNSYWTPEDTAALWLDCDPKYMNDGTIAPYLNDPIGNAYTDRALLIRRAQDTGDLEIHLRPLPILKWTDGLQMPLPNSLREAILEFERRRTPPAPTKALAIQPPNYSLLVDPREHRTLKLLVAAMAADKYGYQHGAPRQGATSKIVSAVHMLGLKIDVDTVLKHLRDSTDAALNDPDRNPNSD